MKTCRLLVCFLVFVALLTGCGKKPGDTNNTVTTNPEVYDSENTVNNDRYPSFAVETISAAKGDQDVVVRVSLKDNPGFLTMAMNIAYDYDNMTLIKVVRGSDYSDYYFVGPKKLQSGCTASWFLPELPEKVVDGNILELHFAINENAESGSYPIAITRSQNGGVVDQFKNEIIFNNAVGYININ